MDVYIHCLIVYRIIICVYFINSSSKEQGIFLKMPKGSMITIGGGWKQFYAEQIDKRAFYALVKEVLDIDEDHIIEFFGAVEHPILYTDCKAHHFHIPVYGRVIIRDVNTLKPVPNGQMGIINLLTPLVKSVLYFQFARTISVFYMMKNAHAG